jgi:hypothetical protein
MTMQPLETFTKQRGIKFECRSVYTRPDGMMEDSAFHYKCRIAQGKRGFTLYFSQGSGIAHDPTASDVLSCLADDAASYENAGSFEEWASEFGLDTDSRKAEKMYRAVKRQAEQLRRVLGDDTYKYLLWDVMNAERDAETA